MQLTKLQESEIMPVYREWWESYLNGDVQTYNHYLDDDFRFVGSTEAEAFLSRRDTSRFFDSTADQLAGRSQLRNSRLTAEYYEGIVFITELADAYLLFGDEWNFYERFRFSSMLKKNEEGWRFIYQHFSIPDSKAQEGETIGLEKVSKENQELRDAIKRNTIELQNKNRELEIEAALERVRAQTMAMHNSEDVGKSIIKMFSELTALGVDEGTRFGIGILNHDNENNQLWTARKDGDEVNMHIGNIDMTSHPLLKSARKAWKEQLPIHKYVLEGEDLLHYYQMLNNAPDYKILVPIEKLPEREFHYGFVFEHGFFYAFTPHEFQPELIHIAQRFSALFEQTYRRYLDLVKAEAQAREAEIELALERVRARSMGMQKSEELKEVIQVVYDQMVQLNILVEHAGFIMDYKERDDMLIWLADEHAIPFQVTLPYFDCAHWNSYKQAKESGVDFFSNLLGFEEKNKFYKDLFSLVPGVTEESLAYYFQCPGLAISTVLLDHVGLYIENFSGIPYTEEENKTLMRFGKVFQQTYTRFLDLQKAESQAREAQIEAALEKVRNRSLAMHRADELGEVVTVVVEKLRELDFPVNDGVALVTYVEGSKDLIEWMENPGFPSAIKFYQPYFDHPVLSDFWKAKNEGLDFISPRYTAEENRSFLEHIFEYGDYKNTLQEVKDYCLAAQTYSYSVAFQKNSSIFINDYSGRSLSGAEIDILKRFSKVFEQAYIRFLDLQNAEAQARESQIQLALERVRARTMAMQHSDELQDAAILLFQQVQALGVQTGSCGFNIWNKDDKTATVWMSSAEGGFQTPFVLPHTESAIYNQVYEAMKNGEMFLIKEVGGKNLKKHFDYLLTLPGIGDVIKNLRKTGYAFPETMVYHFAFFTQGYLSFHLHEHHPETHDIFQRFAKVFEQTYTRFLDLQKAEAQAKEAQIELSLERIRSQVTAMQESSDLLDIVVTMRTEFVKLGHEAHYFWHMRWLPERYDKAMTSGDGKKIGMVMTLPRHIHGDIPLVADWEKTKEPTVVLAMDVETAVDYVEKMITLGDFEQVDPQAPTLDDIRHIGGLTFVMARTTHGEIGYSLPGVVTDPPKDAVDTLVRFAGVFDLAYKRFEDLKAAERQHREAQIELALERVRARTMAMQHSDELADASQVLDQQVRALGIETWGSAFHIYADNTEGDYEWFSSANGNLPFYKTPREKFFLTFYEKGQQGEKLYVEEFKGEDCKTHYDFLKTIPVMGDALRNLEASGIHLPTYQIDHIVFFQHGYILFITYKPVPEAHEIFKRFAKVFEQTYTRFLDLQKAEAQAREAQIEASLEKVRAHTMGMQKSEDLSHVALVMFEQMKNLGGELFSFAIVLCDKHEHMVEQWHNIGNEGMISPFYVPIDLDYIHRYRYDQWKAGATLFSIEIPGNYIARHFELMFELPSVQAAMNEAVAQGIQVQVPEWEIDYGASFKYGYLLVSSFKPFNEDYIFPRFAKVFDQAYTRFLDLQKAEAQTREAKIETALEKVRSRTMGMQSSEELPEVANLLFTEVRALGIHAWSCGYNILAEDKKTARCCMSSEGTLQTPFQLRLWGEASFDEMGDFIRSDKTMLVQELGGKALQEHYAYMKSFPDLKPTFDEIDRLGLSLPTYQINHLCKFTQGFILFITYEKVPDAHDIFKRFTNVFDQTYTRFLDLKKAEAQAREATIEAALERTRTQSMLMQHSGELNEISKTFHEQLLILGIDSEFSFVWLPDEEKNEHLFWATWVSEEVGVAQYHSRAINYPLDKTEPGTAACYVAWESTEPVHETFVPPGDIVSFFATWKELLTGAEKIKPEFFPDGIYYTEAYMKYGCFGIDMRRRLDADEKEIIRRFAVEFERTYTRFLDLKKAEEQARKAQIENALEKVRSRSLAMQSPDELIEVAQLLREEMGALGVEELETSSIYIHDENTGTTQCWFTIKNTEEPDKAVTDQMTINLRDTWVGRKMMDFYHSLEKQTSILMQGAQRIEWIRYCEERATIFSSGGFYGDTIPDRTYHLYKFSDGFIGAAAPGEISQESWELLQRATAVFSFAYTRFHDLQMAEASARAARRQASLDRVRADISSMRSTEDLDRITPLIWNELTTLGIPFIRCGIFIVNEKMETVAVHLSSPDGNSLAVMNLAFGANELTNRAVDAWKKNEVHVQHWDKTDFINYGKLMVQEGQVKDLNAYQGNAEAPESLHLHFIPFSQGLLYVGAPQLLDKEQTQLLSMLAKTFAIAYARYEDFVKLEQAKAEVESAMSELKATQSQLVQQEKLASLGQLTAGIAHEIKNPLNFVNNFTEVSIELIEEALEEMLKHDDEKDASLINHNLEDIKANLRKVYDHGSRANSIVNSMLMHSRGGGGSPEPTLLNDFIREYNNLAFHGMRAGKAPLDVQIILDLDENIREVPIIREDFSRVVLNICNNAFDAMREKKKKYEVENTKYEERGSKYDERDGGTESYLPTLSIQTRLVNGNVLIQFEDNGLGIPDEIKDKILQPFFTTKKGTEGTGLGLSISNDIIKAHGGELKVDAKEGQGSVFSIVLPSPD